MCRKYIGVYLLSGFAFSLLLTGCADPRPVFVQQDVIPNESKSCVAEAKSLRIACKSEKLALFEQCQGRQTMLHQQQLSTHTTNLSTLQAQLQSCISRCIQNTHTYKNKDGSVTTVTNSPSDCTDGYSPGYLSFIRNDGECTQIKKSIDSMGQQPSIGSCDHIYASCEEEYKLNYERCGATYKSVCVKNCEQLNKTP